MGTIHVYSTSCWVQGPSQISLTGLANWWAVTYTLQNLRVWSRSAILLSSSFCHNLSKTGHAAPFPPLSPLSCSFHKYIIALCRVATQIPSALEQIATFAWRRGPTALQCRNIAGNLPIGDGMNEIAAADIVYSHVFESANAALLSSTKARLIAEYPYVMSSM